MTEWKNDLLLKSLREVERLRAALHHAEESANEPIAVLSMACRAPGDATSPEALWSIFDRGQDVIGPVPPRWDLEQLYDPDPAAIGKTYVRDGGLLSDLESFDASLFGISAAEASAMDPQQRWVLEVAWEVLERAGIVPARLVDSLTGVYLGSMGSDYVRGSGLEDPNGHLSFGSASSVLAGRISYVLGLQGPSFTVDTACSSSLVALHLACTGLRRGECDLAITGGVHAMCSPHNFVLFSRLRGLARDGRCKAFSADADGVGWAEGCGLLLLKRLSDATRDGDRVLAVIRGSAVNHDGRSQGLTAPHGPSQVRVIREALSASGLVPSEIDVIEAHGTGTTLGDPIEAGAISEVFAPSRDSKTPLWLGSSKSNLGHAQGAAGVFGVMKMVLALQHERLPKTLHASTPSPYVDWDQSRLALLQQGQPWPRAEGRARRAGVSSFGISGTNAHLVLEEAPSPAEEAPGVEGPSHVPWIMSGRSEAGLAAQASRLAAYLREGPDLPPRELAASLVATRTAFAERLAFPVDTRHGAHDIAAALEAFAEQKVLPRGGTLTPRAHASGRLAALFTGQGSQRLDMGRGLLNAFEAYAEAFEACCQSCNRHLPRPLESVIFAAPGSSEAALLAQTQWTQPALFALETALFRLWESLGVRFDVLLGHSVGELTAAHVAEVLSLEDAARLVCARGRLMAELAKPGGAMGSVQATEPEVDALLSRFDPSLGPVDIAAINGPDQIVVSGDTRAVSWVLGHFEVARRRVRRLDVSHAFHSADMEGMLASFAVEARQVAYGRPTLPIVSNVTGRWADPDAGDLVTADYWIRHVRGTVRFHDGVRTLADAGVRCWLECGPDGILQSLVAGCLGQDGLDHVLATSLSRDRSDPEALASAAGALFCSGRDVSGFFAESKGPRAPLPTYAFERQRFRLDTSGAVEVERPAAPPLAPSQTRQSVSNARPAQPRPPAAGPYIPPRNDRETQLCALWQELLEIETVGIDDDFFALGGHSVLASQLSAQLGSQYGLHVPVSTFFEAPTVRGLAMRLHGGAPQAATDGPPHSRPLDPDAETLDPTIDPAGLSPIAGPIRQVFLTGATGFLGAFLVEALLEHSDAHITCLVRGPDDLTAKERLFEHFRSLRILDSRLRDRVSVILGDLGSPRLGLTATDFRELARRMDAIYHAGAWVNFIYPYSALRDVNVGGTHEILRLACTERLKAVHFVSTAAVFASADYDRSPPVLETEIPRASAAGLSGYEQSKCAAERLVRIAHARGVPVTVHRPATVTGHTRTGATNVRDLALRMIVGCIDLGAWPDLDRTFHMAPVDWVATTIVHLSRDPNAIGRAFHCTSPTTTSVEALAAVVNDLGFDLPTLPFSRWRERLLAAVLHEPEHPLAPFAPLFGEQPEPLRFRLDCRAVRESMAERGLECPPFDPPNLRKTLSYLASNALGKMRQGH